jgi:ferric-dicitrate binding protein FerR (iron transport regulator)
MEEEKGKEKEQNVEKVDYNDIIIKFLSREISDEELLSLKLWLESNPDNKQIFDEENNLWQDIRFNTKSEHFNPDSGWLKISAKLGLGNVQNSTVSVVSKKIYRSLIAAASVALILAIGGVGMYFNLRPSLKNKPLPQISTITTNEGEKSHVYLSDGTSVFLNSGSTLKYNTQFNIKDREIDFTGEAFFEVKTNPEKPFIVKTGQVTVVATGTKFNVQAYQNEDRVETTLEEGILEVSVNQKEPVMVKPGQQVAYFKKLGAIILRDASVDTYSSWKENKLRFNDTPFLEAMNRISRRYNVRIEITSKKLLDITYTATFIDESIEDVMLILKHVSPIPITYKIYHQTSVNDKTYTKPKIVIGSQKR